MQERKSELRTQTKCLISGVETDQPQTQGEAVRLFCRDCSGGDVGSILTCVSKNRCALWPFRFGKNPFSRKSANMSTTQKQTLVERLKQARGTKNDKT